MKTHSIVRPLLAFAFLVLSLPAFAAVQLIPVTSGLSSPIFVGNAKDGRNRLFIVEQGGRIKVLQPGATTATVFLDISSKIVAGGERGLLGLAFHAQYASNGRFFVQYTRAGDGAIVIAEYRVSSNPNVASTTETVLLTIPHPTNTNHNGGMIAFGPDGYLYSGIGDGGGSNDPSNNAQNINVLLGKLLRIDVDHPNPTTGARYSSPADNPFVNTGGRDEIFALGFRNPWRFSFDRLSGQLWVADVGQGAREEVDSPIVKGGNYGWRVFEGTVCTNIDPALCVPANYRPPVLEYAHTGGRCSITGGYVYRGTAGTVPLGTYVFADFCSGEIFVRAGAVPSLLLDTTLNVSSFGEDEAGELYVVGLGGTVHRLTTMPAGSTTTLASSANPAPAGTVVTFTATVVGISPTGSVSFSDAGSTISGCGAVALSGTGNSRTARCSTSALAPGVHSIVARYAGDTVNNGSSSAPLSQTINAGGGTTTTVWVDDALPAGARVSGNEPFAWVTASPAPFSGTRAHRSIIASGVHQHYFTGATAKLSVGVGDKLFAYVYLDPANPPREVMLQWYDGSWEHRAYWGADLIPWGASNRGPLPPLGQWVRLEVPASAVNLEGRTVSGMAFTVYDGRATWDYAGKTSGTGGGGGGGGGWVDDALPTGARASGSEPFTWVTANPAPFSGTRAHQSIVASGVHQHYFTGATTTLSVGTGDKLFAYVYLDPAHPPREVMLQWYDGSWEHRAYWGADLIPWGASNRGPLPPLGQWVRLEVPASAVDLEGRTVSGMAFTVYDGRATWDLAGKVPP
jgi:glucose/arabinose dehydrogenase